MLWITITLMVSMAVSTLLDFVDRDSEGNRTASLIVRGITLFVCLISLVDVYAK